MRAVILAAGEGRRMRPLTETVPKPLLPLAGKPLLVHLFEALPTSVDEVILVVGYRASQIQDHFGSTYGRKKISYIYQEKPQGTASALFLCRDYLRGQRFLSLFADDLHGVSDLQAITEHPLAAAVAEVDHPERFGVVTLNGRGFVETIIEKPERPQTNLALTGVSLLDDRIFNYWPEPHKNGEHYLADSIGALARDHAVHAFRQSFWLPIGYPEDIARAEKLLLSRQL